MCGAYRRRVRELVDIAHVELAAELVDIELVELVGIGAGRTCAESVRRIRARWRCSVRAARAPCALLVLLMLSLPNQTIAFFNESFYKIWLYSAILQGLAINSIHVES